MSLLAYPAALAAAATFAVAFRWNTASRTSAASRPAHSAASGGTPTGRWWLTGMVLNTVGLRLHGFALHAGSLAVVRPR